MKKIFDEEIQSVCFFQYDIAIWHKTLQLCAPATPYPYTYKIVLLTLKPILEAFTVWL